MHAGFLVFLAFTPLPLLNAWSRLWLCWYTVVFHPSVEVADRVSKLLHHWDSALCCGGLGSTGSDTHPVRGMVETHQGQRVLCACDHSLSLPVAEPEARPWTELAAGPGPPVTGLGLREAS